MDEKSFLHFWDLTLYQEARQFKKFISKLAKALPAEEKYRLIDQLLRASRSVGTQIAEGPGRHTWKDQLKYCVTGRGSLNEVASHLYDAFDEDLISQPVFDSGLAQYKRVELLLNGYIKYLKNKLPPTR